MERPSPISFVVPLAAAGAAVVTAWAGHGMQLTLAGAAAGYAVCMALAGVAYVWQLRGSKRRDAEKKKEEELRKAEEDERDERRNALHFQTLVEAQRKARAEAIEEEEKRREAEINAEKEWREYDRQLFFWALTVPPDEEYFRGELHDPLGNEIPGVREALDRLLAVKATTPEAAPRPLPPPERPKCKRPFTSADPQSPQSPKRAP